MNTFILLILMIDQQGNEHIDRVNNIYYQDRLSCLVDKSVYSHESIIESDDHVTKSIKYFCDSNLLYKSLNAVIINEQVKWLTVFSLKGE